MKRSRYNIFVDTDDGKKLAFNSASSALAEIEADKYPTIQRILNDPTSVSTEEERQFYAALCHGKYLIDDEVDEFATLKVRNRQQRFAKAEFSLTIAPTLACNFKCDYCFVSQQAVRMSPETERALLRFKESDLKRAEKVSLTWFGGEPTLCPDTIERLQDGYRELCNRYRIDLYPSGIITNGYLLDRAMAARLSRAGVNTAQITLDGPQEVHDSRRRLHNGKGTFARIVDNIGEATDTMKIQIRVNVDRSNIDMTLELMDHLSDQKILPKVAMSFAEVTSSKGVCADMRDQCFSVEEFSREQLQLYKTLMGHGYTQIQYPRAVAGGFCGADSENSWVVSPSGDLFKCWEELSEDKGNSVGSVFDLRPEPKHTANLNRYLAWDPFVKSDCVKCNILPLCMGGCPIRALEINSKETGACCSWKYNLKEMLMLRYLCDLQETRKEVNR